MKKLLAPLLAVCLLLAGCTKIELPPFPVITPVPEATEAPSPTPAPTPEPTPTPTPEPTPEPIPYLDVETGDIRDWFQSEASGGYMDYYMYVPEKAVESMPLIVFLHGDGYVGLPDDLQFSGIVKNAKSIYGDEMPFILLLPSTSVPSWNAWNIPATLIDLIDRIAEEYSVDTDRIALTGHSRGAIGVWSVVSRYPGYFSAAVPVSCSCEDFIAESFTETPVWAFVGDNYSDYGIYGEYLENMVCGLQQKGAEAQLTVIPDCTHGEAGTKAYTEEVFDWMIAQ